MGTENCPSRDRLGDRAIAVWNMQKTNTRLHTGFPSCSLAGLTSPSHQDTSRGPSECENRDAQDEDEDVKDEDSAVAGLRLVGVSSRPCMVKTLLRKGWFGEQLDIVVSSMLRPDSTNLGCGEGGKRS